MSVLHLQNALTASLQAKREFESFKVFLFKCEEFAAHYSTRHDLLLETQEKADKALLVAVHAELPSVLRWLSALVAWSCQQCGARFVSKVAPVELKGVTYCAVCAENRTLRQQIAALKRELTEQQKALP